MGTHEQIVADLESSAQQHPDSAKAVESSITEAKMKAQQQGVTFGGLDIIVMLQKGAVALDHLNAGTEHYTGKQIATGTSKTSPIPGGNHGL